MYLTYLLLFVIFVYYGDTFMDVGLAVLETQQRVQTII